MRASKIDELDERLQERQAAEKHRVQRMLQLKLQVQRMLQLQFRVQRMLQLKLQLKHEGKPKSHSMRGNRNHTACSGLNFQGERGTACSGLNFKKAFLLNVRNR